MPQLLNIVLSCGDEQRAVPCHLDPIPLEFPGDFSGWCSPGNCQETLESLLVLRALRILPQLGLGAAAWNRHLLSPLNTSLLLGLFLTWVHSQGVDGCSVLNGIIKDRSETEPQGIKLWGFPMVDSLLAEKAQTHF